MISSGASTLVRRAVAAHNNADFEVNYQLPVWGAVLLGVTVALFFALDFMIEYTFGRLVPTLLMVESPQSLYQPTATNEDPDAPLEYKDEKTETVEPELLLVKQPLITSSFRSTLVHLKARAGRMSRFRGLSMFVMYTMSLHWSTSVLSRFVPTLAAPVLAHALCANLSMAWTHIVISEASPLPWYKRIPSRKVWFKVLPATALTALVCESAMVTVVYIALNLSSGLSHESIMAMTPNERKILAAQGISIIALAIFLVTLVVIPAKVGLTRIQASLLSQETETIVPFDRTFKGTFDPEGEKTLMLLDAVRTFDWSDRVRLIKAYAKVTAMSAAVSVLFFVAIAGELILILGNDIQKFLPKKDN